MSRIWIHMRGMPHGPDQCGLRAEALPQPPVVRSSGDQDDTEGTATVRRTIGAFRMLTKARRELA